MTPALSVIMPTFNRANLLPRVLSAYEAQVGSHPFELIAADDGSTDGTLDLLRSYRPRRFTLRPLGLGRNRGPGSARNEAMAVAAAPLLLIVGDDILPAPDLLAQHLTAHENLSDPAWAVLGRTMWSEDLPQNNLMRHVDGLGAQQFSYAHLRDGQEVDFRHFYTSNISIKSSILESLQTWFDPAYTFAAYEDVEFAYRLTRSVGLRIRYIESAWASHHHYYGIWSFAKRQFRCGLMAAVFLRQHPELRRAWRADRLRRVAFLASLPPLRHRLGSVTAADVDTAEEVALTLGSLYELDDSSVTDLVYLPLLEYFVLKGLLEGEVGLSKASRPLKGLLLFGLLPELAEVLSGVERPMDAEGGAVSATIALADHFGRRAGGWPSWAWRKLLRPFRSAIRPRY